MNHVFQKIVMVSGVLLSSCSRGDVATPTSSQIKNLGYFNVYEDDSGTGGYAAAQFVNLTSPAQAGDLKFSRTEFCDLYHSNGSAGFNDDLKGTPLNVGQEIYINALKSSGQIGHIVSLQPVQSGGSLTYVNQQPFSVPNGEMTGELSGNALIKPTSTLKFPSKPDPVSSLYPAYIRVADSNFKRIDNYPSITWDKDKNNAESSMIVLTGRITFSENREEDGGPFFCLAQDDGEFKVTDNLADLVRAMGWDSIKVESVVRTHYSKNISDDTLIFTSVSEGSIITYY